MAHWAPGDLFDSAFLESLVANPYYEESRNVPSGNGHSAGGTTTSQPSAELFCFKLYICTYIYKWSSLSFIKQHDLDIYSAPIANLTSSIW